MKRKGRRKEVGKEKGRKEKGKHRSQKGKEGRQRVKAERKEASYLLSICHN